jgi:DNA-binding HxlR family transcriptional regulator
MGTEKHAAAPAYDAVCLRSIRNVMDVFGGKWSFLVLEQLHIGTMRFGELSKALGISTKSLTDTLRRLEENGIIKREAIPTVPVTVEYSLTDKGRAFDSVLLAMKDWSGSWM